MKIGVLASHEGTTLQAVLDACSAGCIAGSVAVVISNNSASGALRRAAACGVRTLHLSGKTHPAAEALDDAICSALESAEVQVVLLAGYMKKLGPRTLRTFAGRILNTHPALLPKYGGQGMFGRHVHEAVLASGEQQSGASVHLVDGEYDTGAVLAQSTVGVEAGDTPESLARRVQASERQLLTRVLAEIASGARQL